MYSSSSGDCSCSGMESKSSDCRNYTKIHNLIRWKSGKRVDPRLAALLELFNSIYEERHEFFKKIFHEDHEELFEKVGDALKRKKQMKKNQTLPRSISMKEIGKRGVDHQTNKIKLERFKVRTPNVIVDGSEGTTNPGGQTQSSSKDSK